MGPYRTERKEQRDAPPSESTATATRADIFFPWTLGELWILAGVVASVFWALQYRLQSVLVSDMDEGTYVYSGHLIASGQTPYRDFMLAHPPLLSELIALCMPVVGSSIVALRLLYIGIVLLASIPLYGLMRELVRSHTTALIALVTYTSGMLLLANMGRTVRLEPMMNAFVIGAFACRFLRPRSVLWMGVMGMLFVAALSVKLVAVIPAAFLFLADVAWDRPWRPVAHRWIAASAGAALVALPVAMWCLHQSRFVEDVLVGQVHRPRLGLGLRLHYLAQNFARFPPVFIGLVAATFLVVNARDTRVRSVALVALASTVVLLLGFKTFFNYYIVQALPWIACCFAIAYGYLARRWLNERWRPAIHATVTIALAVIAPVAYVQVYERSASAHVAAPRQIISLLKGGSGYVYSMYPAYALLSGRPLYPWYYQADSLVPRINGWVSDDDFLEVFSRSNALVLFTGELEDYPHSRRYVEGQFSEKFTDDSWSVWIRR